jgi:hypothetical protein
MPSSFSYPTDLAVRVIERLTALHRQRPARGAMTKLFEVAFFASMRTEEADSIRCSLTYINPERPDPHPPEHVVANRWRSMPFPERLELTPNNLVKIAKSFDSEASSVAVYSDESCNPFIWGALDQHGRRTRFMMRESDEGMSPAGVLECAIVGVGALEIYKDYTLLAALRQGTIAVGSNDVLGESGPVRRALQPAIDALVAAVHSEVGADVFAERDHWKDSLAGYWTTSLSRILLGVQRYAHGGSIVLTPDDAGEDLAIKYPLPYRRLGPALAQMSARTIERCVAEDEIHENFLARHAEDVPAILHLDEVVNKAEEEDAEDEVTGCVRFIASLSRVDGAVIMDRALSVRGYGAIIQAEDLPVSVWFAGDVRGRVADLRRVNPRHFGTRHQSMMRYCHSHPGSVGFVVSQDGDVRAMMRVRDRLIVWEDVRLRRI